MQFNSVERVIEYTALPVEGGKPDDRGGGSSGTVAKQVGRVQPALLPHQKLNHAAMLKTHDCPPACDCSVWSTAQLAQ